MVLHTSYGDQLAYNQMIEKLERTGNNTAVVYYKVPFRYSFGRIQENENLIQP